VTEKACSPNCLDRGQHESVQLLRTANFSAGRPRIGQSDLISILREEILAGIAKHIRMDPDKIHVKMERGDTVSTLEVEVEIPTPRAQSATGAGLASLVAG